jgi:hypothetical protein
MFTQSESPCSRVPLRNFLSVWRNVVSKAQKYFHRDLHLREWRGSHSKWKLLRGYLWMWLLIHRHCRGTSRLTRHKGVAVWKYSLVEYKHLFWHEERLTEILKLTLVRTKYDKHTQFRDTIYFIVWHCKRREIRRTFRSYKFNNSPQVASLWSRGLAQW